MKNISIEFREKSFYHLVLLFIGFLFSSGVVVASDELRNPKASSHDASYAEVKIDKSILLRSSSEQRKERAQQLLKEFMATAPLIVAEHAMAYAYQSGNAVYVPELKKRLSEASDSDDDLVLQISATRALFTCAGEYNTENVLSWLNHSNGKIRGYALRLARQTKDPALLEATLLRSKIEGDPQLKVMAFDLLCYLDPQNSKTYLNAIRELSEERSYSCRLTAGLTLIEHGQPFEWTEKEADQPKFTELAQTAVRLVKFSTRKESSSRTDHLSINEKGLIHLISSDFHDLRVLAIEGLAKLDTEPAKNWLEKSEKEKHWRLRLVYAYMLYGKGDEKKAFDMFKTETHPMVLTTLLATMANERGRNK